MAILLTRDQFREGVFKRDDHKCVMCGAVAVDAHHIMERRLFEDGGYYLSNGASVCKEHHIKAEETTLSCEEIRAAAKIKEVILPPHLYGDNDYTYDKWGNINLKNGMKVKGELFYDESVQKILAQGNVLDLFLKYTKYPRTMHLPWSEKLGKDDRIIPSLSHFEGKEIIVTAKMDGENTSMYKDHIHARSLDSASHPSRKWVKGLWAQISYEIPEGWRVCGENLYSIHTIPYKDLPTYFMAFSIWNEKNICLSWEETMEWFTLLNLQTVPILYKGIYDEKILKTLYKPTLDDNACEGYVVRLANEFAFSEFRKSVAKFVSKNFEIKHGHWSSGVIKTNLLKAK